MRYPDTAESGTAYDIEYSLRISWICANNHQFDTDRTTGPGQCPTCKTPLIKAVYK